MFSQTMNMMKMTHNPMRSRLALALPLCLTFAVLNSCTGADSPKTVAPDAAKDKPTSATGDLVPLAIKLPAPAFKGTPKDIQLSSYVEPLSDKPRPPMMVP